MLESFSDMKFYLVLVIFPLLGQNTQHPPVKGGEVHCGLWRQCFMYGTLGMWKKIMTEGHSGAKVSTSLWLETESNRGGTKDSDILFRSCRSDPPPPSRSCFLTAHPAMNSSLD